MTHPAAAVGVNDAPRMARHGDRPVSVVESTESGVMLDVRIIDTVPEGFAGLQISDPDTGDEVTLRLAGGGDAALFELVRVGEGRFALMWKAGPAAAPGPRFRTDARQSLSDQP